MVAATLAAASKTERDSQLPLSVGWVGPRPGWLEQDEAGAELEGVELQRIDARERLAHPPHLVHVARSALGELSWVRKALPETPIVLDLTGEGDTSLTRADARRTKAADAFLAGSRWELEQLARRLGDVPAGSAVVPRPLDLDWYSPEPRLAETKGRGRDLRRFRRFHRLAGPTVLFAGPYKEPGGLDLLIEAVFRLHERMPDLRLAAVPHGPTDPRYRDRCEMRILGLGHHGIVEWSPDDAEIPFWYATAAVVCAPSRATESPEPAKRAAAAARPFVGSNLEPFREHVDEGATGRLVPVGDLDALETTLETLLDAEDEAGRLGEAARRKAESEYSPPAAARTLRGEWESLGQSGHASSSRNRRT
jgi:glycosyltransferase involved in cell wall biosynthesis